MKLGSIRLAIAIAAILIYSGSAIAANPNPRTCVSGNASLYDHGSLPTGGSGGTGHDPKVPPGGIGGTGNSPAIPPGGIGGNGIEAASNGGIGGTGHSSTIPPGGIGGNGIEASSGTGGIGGTGNMPTIPPGGIGGNGIETASNGGGGNTPIIPPGGVGGTGITVAGNLSKASGTITVFTDAEHQLNLVDGDAICNGDRIIVGNNSQAKIEFTDGAVLYVLQNTEVKVDDYHYASAAPQLSRSLVSLAKGDIRSVSGAISKINPAHYAIKTPAATIHVIGTDFLVTHLPTHDGALDTGTYTKVISGEISVTSATNKVHLRAGESSHVLLNGTQSVINSGGGTCKAP